MCNRQRILLVLSLLLVGGFTLTSLASFFVSRASLERQVAQSELPLTSDNIYSEIQRDLLQPIFIASLMAQDTFLRDWVLAGEKDPEQVRRYLHEIKTKYGTVTSFFVSEKTRTYYYADGILKTVQPDAERDRWYFRVREMASSYEVNVDPDMANHDTMTIFVNYRVLGYDGQFLGATGVGLTVSAVKRLIEDYQRRFNRQVYFVDAAGRIVLHGERFDIVSGDNLATLEGVGALAPQILKNGSGSYSYQRQGRRVLLNTRFIPEFGWHLLVEQSTLPGVRRLLHILLLNLAICAGITLLVLGLAHRTLAGYQRRLEEMATTDKLTGLLNRQACDLLFAQAMKEIARSREPLSVILLDLDGFKEINDRYGHLAGDVVLQEVAQRLKASLRDSDLVCRWGGDEFLLILKGCARADAEQRAQALKAVIEEEPYTDLGRSFVVRVSLGAADYQEGDLEEDLVCRADEAMYQGKQARRPA